MLIVGFHLFLANHFVVVEVKGQLQLVGSRAHSLIVDEPFLDALHLLHLFLSPLHVVPKVGSLCAQLFFLELHLLLRDVQVVVQFLSAVENIL